MKHLFLALRPHQWLKNLLILLPLVFGQQLLNLSAFLKTVSIFFIFCLVSSAVYLINDIIDLESDKKHLTKKKRPLASGKITVFQAKTTAFILGIVGMVLSFILDMHAGWVIIVYIALNYTYMKTLKKAIIIDVFCIGAFFYLRILAGAITSNVVLSNWIIMCTVLLALFLAFNKRRYDLEVSKDSRTVFSKYSISFIDRMISVISASIVIVYTLYVMDASTIERFGTNHLIYTVPFVYYGVFRYLYLIDTKSLDGDPARILISDYKIQINLALWLIVSIAVIYFKV